MLINECWFLNWTIPFKRGKMKNQRLTSKLTQKHRYSFSALPNKKSLMYVFTKVDFESSLGTTPELQCTNHLDISIGNPKHSSLVWRCSIEKVFLEILQNSQENTCAGVSFLIKLQARPATLLKKKLWHRCFPVNFAKFLRKSFFTEHLRWLLLQVYLPSLSYQCHETVQRESPVRSGQTPNCTLQ